jgi:hypothetical protein
MCKTCRRNDSGANNVQVGFVTQEHVNFGVVRPPIGFSLESAFASPLASRWTSGSVVEEYGVDLSEA